MILETHAAQAQPGFGDGSRSAWPIVLGYLAIGVAFGVVARTQGLTLMEIALMSTLVYAGSAQFIGVSMIATGEQTSAIILTTFLVNLRHLLMSASLAQHFPGLRWWKGTAIGLQLTDESFAVASTHFSAGVPPGFRWMAGLNLTSQASWIGSTVLGGWIGQALPDPTALGLDFALAAMFIGLLILQAETGPKVAAAMLAGGLALFIGHILPGRWEVIAATVIAATVGAWLER